MKQSHEELPPPVRLALAYAPKQVRAGWELLLRFDSRFAGIVGATSEPLIGQMKLAWWRDAIGTAPSMRPKGEPLLAQLSEIGDPVLEQAVGALVDAWEGLVVSDEWHAAAIEQFSNRRGAAVFGAYSTLCALPYFPELLARQWAIDDLQLRFGGKVPQNLAKDAVVPNNRFLRPLTILAMSVRQNSGPRLVWHALTGR